MLLPPKAAKSLKLVVDIETVPLEQLHKSPGNWYQTPVAEFLFQICRFVGQDPAAEPSNLN